MLTAPTSAGPLLQGCAQVKRGEAEEGARGRTHLLSVQHLASNRLGSCCTHAPAKWRVRATRCRCKPQRKAAVLWLQARNSQTAGRIVSGLCFDARHQYVQL